MCIHMPDPLDDGVHFEADIHKCRIRAFHENFSPTHSQSFRVDRGPKDVMVECRCAPVAADMSDRYPSGGCEVSWEWGVQWPRVGAVGEDQLKYFYGKVQDSGEYGLHRIGR